MTVLLLGGTAEARDLAARLVDAGLPVVTSLAGAVADLRLPEGTVRVGGFGGADGMAVYLRGNDITAVVDATHPFAAGITANAAAACATTGTRLLRLSRPSWGDRPAATSWHWVDSLEQARSVAVRCGGRLFLAVGRQGVGAFTDWPDRYVLLRVIDPPDVEPPAGWEVLRARGPFTVDGELELLRSRGIEVLVAKDSGGPTDAKLVAAGQLGLPVVMVRRPPVPHGVLVVTTVADALAWAAAVRPR